MALVESNAPLADPHIVGNAFVQKYYNHLYESPSQVHRFYLEDSVLGRPGSDGEMVSVNSLKVKMNTINKFVLFDVYFWNQLFFLIIGSFCVCRLLMSRSCPLITRTQRFRF